ncbi:MAG: acyl-CoA dehydrogenase [Saprospiraceae bacterium]|nr:acyl-CoA dehydrogenase [Saprospiraceae bacterium]
MMEKYMNMDTLRFQLFDVLKLEELLEYEHYQDFDKESVNIFLDSIKDFSDQELFSCFREMDEQPARYEDGKIIVHPQVKTMMEKGGELGMIGGVFDYDDGGMQIPGLAFQAANYIMEAANNHLPGYIGLTTGAAGLIVAYGSQELKDTYTPKMFEGKWGGTMCLTEPQAGSSLSDITTVAYPQEDGSYKIKGQKIFISGGDHEYCENVVHLLLARIEGAPAGTKGISLFVVPKNRITESGLEGNDVQTAGDFQKMGQKGYCTTHLVFGEQDDCLAWLVGEENRGLTYMFKMMNEARIGVGRGAVAIASAAYHASLQYANERPQGRKIENDGKKNVDAEQTLIINHPDVRRMLLSQKAIYEGALSLTLQSALYHDLSRVTEGEEQEKYHLLLELLTPITKTYPSEKGRKSIDNGLQILGGYGFCTDFVLQQYYRDIRIFSLYEGTTGIQSLDLLARKITMNNGRALQLLVAEMQEAIEAAMTFDELKPYATDLENKMQLTQQVLTHLLGYAMKGKYQEFLADATIFMEFMGTIVIAWQWLKLATVAKEALVTGQGNYTADFYESNIHTMKFFYKYELSRTTGLADILMSTEMLTILKEKELIA